jgi:hypothetical protein
MSTLGTTFLLYLIVAYSAQFTSLTLLTKLIIRNLLSGISLLISVLLCAHLFILEEDNLFP